MIRLLLTTVLISVVSTTWASAPAGVVAALAGIAQAVSSDGTTSPLSVGSQVFEGDRLTTAPGAKLQVLLNDQTSIKIGSDAEFVLDGFAFNSDGGDQVKASITKGIFRFVSGKVAKVSPQNVSVDISTATIGVRGTEFSGEVGPEETYVVLLDGGIDVTSSNGQVVISEPGFSVGLDNTGTLSPVTRLPETKLQELLNETTVTANDINEPVELAQVEPSEIELDANGEPKTEAPEVELDARGEPKPAEEPEQIEIELDANGQPKEINVAGRGPIQFATELDDEGLIKLPQPAIVDQERLATNPVTDVTRDQTADTVPPTPVLGSVNDEVAENTLEVATLNVTGGTGFTFELSGSDAALFELDTEGKLSFRSAPNFEAPSDTNADNRYDLSVEIKNAEGETAIESLSVKVNDVPSFQAGDFVAPGNDSLAQNSFQSIAGQSDFLNRFSEGGRYTFNSQLTENSYTGWGTIYSGSISGVLSLVSRTLTLTADAKLGQAYFNNPPQYDLTVNMATRGLSQFPTTPGGLSYDFSFLDATKGLLFDEDAGDSATYSGPFNEFPDFVISLIPGTTPGGLTRFNTQLSLSDIAGESEDSAVAIGTAQVAVNTADVICDFCTYRVRENQNLIAEIIQGYDVDSNQIVSYSLTGADADLFSVDSTGLVTTASGLGLDFETWDGDPYQFNVVLNTAQGREQIPYRISVRDQGPDVRYSGATTVQEGAIVSGQIAIDSGVTYRLSGADESFFEFNTSTGQLSLKEAVDYESPQDVDGNNLYQVTINATDLNNEVSTRNLNFTVTNRDPVTNTYIFTPGETFGEISRFKNLPFQTFAAAFSEGGVYDFRLDFAAGDSSPVNGSNNVTFNGSGMLQGVLDADQRTLSAKVKEFSFTENGTDHVLDASWGTQSWNSLAADQASQTKFVLSNADRVSLSCSPSCKPNAQVSATIEIGGSDFARNDGLGLQADRYYRAAGSVAVTPDADESGVAEARQAANLSRR